VMEDWFTSKAAGDADQAVADYMSRLAVAPTQESPTLPGADVLWLKAQMLKRWEAERRAQAPLDVMEPVQVVIGLAAATVLLVWSLPSLIRALALLNG
jgi:hypothetical protein